MRRLIVILVCFISGVVFAGDISVEPCRKCDNKGYRKCPGCLGKGKASNASIECPVCKGAKEVDCDECDEEGMVRCPQKCKKLKTKEGLSEKTMILNPKWGIWGTKGLSLKAESAEPPEKYIVCPVCQGEGKIKCKRCDGTKKAKCKKCKGKGTISGYGECSVCGGSGEIICEECAVLPEGAAKKFVSSLETLDKLRAEKLIDTDPGKNDLIYWQKRREIVAEAKTLFEKKQEKEEIARKKAEEQEKKQEADRLEKEKQDAEEKAAMAEKTAKKDKVKAERQEKMKDLKLLMEAFSKGVISLEMYDKQKRVFGLTQDEIKNQEKKYSEKNKRLAKYLDIEEKFKNGEYDYNQYRKELEKANFEN